MGFTKTLLHERPWISSLPLTVFRCFLANRTKFKRGKEGGAALAAFINSKWCHSGHITMKDHFCSPLIEVLVAELHYITYPSSLYAILLVDYISPFTCLSNMAYIIKSVTVRLLSAPVYFPHDFWGLKWSDFVPISLSLWTSLPRDTGPCSVLTLRLAALKAKLGPPSAQAQTNAFTWHSWDCEKVVWRPICFFGKIVFNARP